MEDYIKNTIWGEAETALPVAQGIHLVTTASHGGYVLSHHRIKVLKQLFPLATPYKGDDRYWEQGCDWVYVIMAFPQCFNDDQVQLAKKQYQKSLDCLTTYADGRLNKPTKGEE
jgi:hypothetical protein